MNEDWIDDILLRGSYQISLPKLTVTSDDLGSLTGSGQISWNADTGIRIQAVTDSNEHLTSLRCSRLGTTPGQLIPRSNYLELRGSTQFNWKIKTDEMPLKGVHIHQDMPNITWDLDTSGITLEENYSESQGRSLRILMGPPLCEWVRMTQTKIDSEVFGRVLYQRDWLTTTCGIGTVSARQRSEKWFEVRVSPPEGQPMAEANEVCRAVARAFGFIIGRRCAIRGYEEINETKKTRRLDNHFPKTTKNTLLQPLGNSLLFMQNVELLLKLAIDFFLSKPGQAAIAPLYLCWDTADNSHLIQLTMSSICVESLLRIAAKEFGPTQPQVDQEVLASFQELMSTSHGIPSHFVERLKGMISRFNELSVAEILRDWVTRGVLGVTKEDLKSWTYLRHRSAHGQITAAKDRNELQTRISHHDRIQNLRNKILLQLMGYTGSYTDYAQKGYATVLFPLIVTGTAAAAEETLSSNSQATVHTLQTDSSFTVPPTQLQPDNLPDSFEGWEIRYPVLSMFKQNYSEFIRALEEALRARFPGATVKVSDKDQEREHPLFKIIITAPEGTSEKQIQSADRAACSIEAELCGQMSQNF